MDVGLVLKKDPDVLRSLQEWLGLEAELRGQVKVQDDHHEAGEMGALGDALVVSVGSGGALSVLFASLKVWFAQPKRSDVQIELRTADGREILLTAERVSQPEKLIREVLGDGGLE